jgi:hypothetical protein
MFNFLSKEQKHKVTKIYHKRLLIIFLIGTMLSVVFAIISLIPSYFLSYIKEKAVVRGADIFEETVSLRKDNSVTLLLRNEREKVDVSNNIDTKGQIRSLLEQVVNNMTDQIKLSGFFFEEKEGDFNRLILRGMADNRGAILEFSSNLDKEHNFENIDLPVSNLVKGEGINFSIDMEITK